MEPIRETERRLQERYRERTPGSRVLHERATRRLPGGDTRAATFYLPYPIFVERGEGCHVYDVDGNEYLDLLNNFTSLVHGHAHPAITEAITTQAARGTVFATPVELQIALADVITDRVPSIELLRFTNSGTEAVMHAIRAARGFTGRSKLLKMAGGYHGGYDAMEVTVASGPDGPTWPVSRAEGPGLSPALVGDTLVAPFNDLETTAAIIHQHRHELAAVIVEPVLGAGGMIPADAEFLRGLRVATHDAGVLLILDEIITFRLAVGGAQQHYGVTPDLTTLGKVIGGGLPIGAFGGRAEIMGLFDPRRVGHVRHSGTFNGSPICVAAGLVALELLTPDQITRINALGDRLRVGLDASFRKLGVTGQATGLGSLVQTHLTQPVRSYEDGAQSPGWFRTLTHLALLNAGILSGWRTSYNISTAMTDTDVRLASSTFERVLDELAPALLTHQSGTPA